MPKVSVIVPIYQVEQYLGRCLETLVNQTLEEIEGLLCVEMQENLASGYDLVFYSEFENQEALKDFQNHPLHEAHKKRCKDLVCKRLCGDIERK